MECIQAFCSGEQNTHGIIQINIQSSFTVQNPLAQLVKIEHVILLYLSSANSDSALLTITHKNRALSTMASADRFAEIVEEQKLTYERFCE